jgi:Txe/YoeB family toxin of Txe-Axe toxin-antitoxin module
MVEADRLERIRQNMSASVPSDILEAQEILTQKESIINQSLLEARRVKETAMREAEAIKASAVEEHAAKVGDAEIIRVAQGKADQVNQEAVQEANQIVQEAQRNAFRIVGDAEKIAAARREGADQYARESLFNLEERLASQLGQVRRGIDALGVRTPSEPVMATAAAS